MENFITSQALDNKEEYIVCPYDKSHLILPHRIQIHLGRCRKNFRNVPKNTCPFNVTHILNIPEFEFHVAHCPDRAEFESNRHESVQLPKHPAPKFEVLTTATSWDEQPPAETYNPLNYVENAPVMRMLHGESKSVKKQFRINERKRMLELEKNNKL